MKHVRYVVFDEDGKAVSEHNDTGCGPAGTDEVCDTCGCCSHCQHPCPFLCRAFPADEGLSETSKSLKGEPA